MSSKIAIIGGSALPKLQGFEITKKEVVTTPYGEPASAILRGMYEGEEILFLDRHGLERRTPPHQINYQANMWALRELGVEIAIGISIVGGIRSDMTPGHFVFPDQLIDYTYGRANTYFEDDFSFAKHLDFTYPYCPKLHKVLIESAQAMDLKFTDDATYGVTQGPRYETIAEVNRLERDGCAIVGMTAMPEAVLARELKMRYCSVAVVGSKAAGRSDGLHVDLEAIRTVIDESLDKMRELLTSVIHRLAGK